MRVLESYYLLLRWQAGRLRSLLPLFVVVQALLSSGLILGLGVLIADGDSTAQLYLATGAPTVALVTVGLVIVPLQVSQAKTEGSIEFLWSLPLPRLAYLAADLTLWLLVSLPGMSVSLLLATARYHFHIELTLMLVATVLLVALTATSIGYAIAASLPPVAAQLVSQALVFVVLMFSPINYSIDRLPGWAIRLHEVLPFQPMGAVMRSVIAPDTFTVSSTTYLIVLGYCAAGLLCTRRLMRRRN